MKRGRPKDISKAINRRHQVYLTKHNEVIHQSICKERLNPGWLNQYVNECFERDFGSPEAKLKHILYAQGTKRDQIESEMKATAVLLSDLQMDKLKKEADAEVQRIARGERA